MTKSTTSLVKSLAICVIRKQSEFQHHFIFDDETNRNNCYAAAVRQMGLEGYKTIQIYGMRDNMEACIDKSEIYMIVKSVVEERAKSAKTIVEKGEKEHDLTL